MNSSDALLGMGIIMICFVLLLIALIPKIFYLLTLQRTMQKISPENREMTPGMVWLELIPLFGVVWQFFNVTYISNSLKKEMTARGMPLPEPRPAYAIGLVSCILICCSVIPVFGFVTIVGGVVCWIIFWVKVANYKNML